MLKTHSTPETITILLMNFSPKGKNHYNSKIYWDKIDKINTPISSSGKEKRYLNRGYNASYKI